MIDPTETLTAALADFGVDALLDGGPVVLRCMPVVLARESFDGELVSHHGPSTEALLADVVSAGLAAGNNGDTLTIDGIDYTLLAIDPDGSGGAVLRLEELD